MKIVYFLNRFYEKVKQHQKFLMLFGIVVAIYITIRAFYYCYDLVFVYPVDQVSQYNITNVTEKANLINQYRSTSVQLVTTSAQIFGGIAVFTGLYFAWGNLTTAREGQITERFTRAVDQLGNKKLEIRLGGIYALGRIANESNKDYWSIMEILTAYIKMNSSIDGIQSQELNVVPIESQGNTCVKEYNDIRKIPFDIQAVINVVGGRKHSYENGENKRLNLVSTNLNKAHFRAGHFEGVNFSFAHLKGAFLEKAHFQRARFVKTHLEFTIFTEAHLEGANFQGAYLKNAFLFAAHIEDANLKEAHLEGAHFEGAHLEGAHFKGARFQRTCLEGAYLEGAHFEGTRLEGAYIKRDDFMKAFHQGAHFKGAIIDDVVYNKDDL